MIASATFVAVKEQNIIGAKMLIELVVSSMITVSEYVSRNYALSIPPTATRTGTTALSKYSSSLRVSLSIIDIMS